MPCLPADRVARAGLGALLALLGACATPGVPVATVAHWRMAPDALRDPPLERYLDQRLAAIAPAGPAAASVLVRAPGLRAEWREPGAILLSTDLLLRVVDDDELAFLLAHELGHARLGHVASASGAGMPDPALERQADRWARDRIAAMGHRDDAGVTLLQALATELAGDPERSPVRDAIESRLAAMRALPTARAPPDPAPAGEWLALQRARREAWAARDQGLRDPGRAALVRARWR